MEQFESNPVSRYLKTVWQVLTHPTRFFAAMPIRGGVAGPLAFALITHWVGEAMGFMWRMTLGGAASESFDRMFKMAEDASDIDSLGRHSQLIEMGERVKHWFWGAGSVIADPFLTLLRIFFISALVYIGARILVTPGRDGAPSEIRFESALRIVCFGLTPSILSAIPLLGGVISSFYIVAVTIIGAREVYRIGNGRAMLVALWPQFLMLALFWLTLMAGMLLMFKFFASAL